MCFDFETTTISGYLHNPEDCEIFPVFYVMTFAFHPNLNLERVIVESNFGQSLENLVNIGYLTQGMLEQVHPVTAQQLRDCSVPVIHIEGISKLLVKCFWLN